jgi:hypothetical protein
MCGVIIGGFLRSNKVVKTHVSWPKWMDTVGWLVGNRRICKIIKRVICVLLSELNYFFFGKKKQKKWTPLLDPVERAREGTTVTYVLLCTCPSRLDGEPARTILSRWWDCSLIDLIWFISFVVLFISPVSFLRRRLFSGGRAVPKSRGIWCLGLTNNVIPPQQVNLHTHTKKKTKVV